MVIFLENEDEGNVLEDTYMGTTLTGQGYFMSNYDGVTHPSQPNYIAYISGSQNGCTSDSNINIAKSNVADLLESKGFTWKNYAESYPGNCYTGANTGTYYRKHTPFISFTDISKNSTRCANIVPATQLATDEAAGTLPNFIFYTPDINNDGHDTNSIFLGKGIVGAGQVDATAYNHYSSLATVESIFGLGNLKLNDATAPIIPFVCNAASATSTTTTTTTITSTNKSATATKTSKTTTTKTITTTASTITSPAGCAHSECSTGTALTSDCSACATAVCAQDSYCCATSWDSTCVSE
ncbi:hypothetical protein HK100_005087, partial [Physocladia obscura]